MTLQDEVSLLDPFTHTKQDRKKIENFEFIEGENVRVLGYVYYCMENILDKLNSKF